MWSVRILSGPQAGQIYDLKKGKNIFGRGSHCDVKILSVGISKEHCEIHVYKDKVMLVDLKSSNGTFVDGVKIQQSIIKLGSKLSLFDIIMDIIPTPEIRPQSRSQVQAEKGLPARINPSNHNSMQSGALALKISPENSPMIQFPQMQGQTDVYSGLNPSSDLKSESNHAPKLELTIKEKIDGYIENVVMKSIYQAVNIFPFHQVLLGFIILFVFIVTTLSIIPLSTITEESNLLEASKRARSVARTLAILNQSALATDQLSNLSVAEALKEDGITEAIIVSQLDGSIVAPSEAVGREIAKPMISQIRREQRAMDMKVDSKTIGASQPIGVYDLNTGETKVKYHAVVFYNVSNLNVDDGRFISLFMQTLIMASLFGLVLHFVFSKLIQYPLVSLNNQIDQALKDKVDRTEVFFDYPVFQQTVANVNLLLSRVSQNQGSNDSMMISSGQRELEFVHIVEMLDQAAFSLTAEGKFIAVNSLFEEIAQMNKNDLLQQHFSELTDPALMQNIESLIARAETSPFEKHSDRIPFSQFECEISLQACLSSQSKPEYYFIVLKKIEAS